MANIKSAKKRARQTIKRRAHNASRRSELRTSIKAVLKAVIAKDKPGAEAAYKIAEPVIDRMASKGIIHANKAARSKARLSARLRTLAA